MDKEKLIAKIMKECELDGEPITRAEAEGMANLEIKAKELKNYTQTEIEIKIKRTVQMKTKEKNEVDKY